MIKKLFLYAVFAWVMPTLAIAQCSGSGGVPFNCTPGSTMGATDTLLGGSAAGANTVKFTGLQAAAGVFNMVPVLSGGGTANFLRADGSWAVPPSGGIAGPGSTTPGFVPAWNGTGGTALGAGFPVGTTGANTVLQTTSGGTLDPSVLPAIPLAGGVTGNLPITNLGGGSGASSSTFWRGDGTWATPAGGGNVSNSGTPAAGQIALWSGSTSIQGAANLPVANLNGGTGASSSTFWRGDGTWATPSGGGNVSASGTPASGQIAAWTSSTVVQGIPSVGSGSVVLATSPTLVTPALGTPSVIVLTNGTGLPISTGVSGMATGIATFLATPSSSNLASAVTNETGSGALVFGTSPTLAAPTFTGATTSNGLTDNTLITAVGGLAFTGAFTPSNTAGNVVNGSITYNYPAVGVDYRPRYWSTTTTVQTGTTSGVAEDNFFNYQLNGAGTISGEINIVHPYVNMIAGVIDTDSIELVEESSLILGTAQTLQGNLSTLTNGVTGTTSQIIGYHALMTNLNSTAGSVGEFDAFLNQGFAGTAPTANFAFKNTDATGSISTAGNVVIGGINAASANVLLQIQGPDASTSTFPVQVKNSAGKTMFSLDDGYNAVLGANLALGGASGFTGTLYFNNATNSQIKIVVPTGTYGPFTLTLPETTGQLAATSVSNTWAGTQTFTNPMSLGITGTTAGALTFFNATSGGVSLSVPSGALGTPTVTIPATTTVLAGLAVAETFSAAQTFSGTLNVTGTLQSGGVAGLASKTCTINSANVTTGITLTITGGIVTSTTTC